MHELSVAMSIVEIAEEEGARLGGRVSAVHLRLGVMAGVVKDALLFSYDVVCEETALAGSRLVIEEVPLAVWCPRCEVQRVLAPNDAFRCAECGTPTPDVRAGRELELVALEIDE